MEALMGFNPTRKIKTTENVERSQKRKKLIRQIRDEKEAKEAAKLNISVFALQCKKAQETEKLIKNRELEAKTRTTWRLKNKTGYSFIPI